MSLKQCSNPACPAAGSSTESSLDLKACSRCLVVAYCSQSCQKDSWPAHKSKCIRQNYLIEFRLMPSCPTAGGPVHNGIVNPEVTRTISCPSNATFYALHKALQIAFGWATTHSFDFAILNPHYEEPPHDEKAYFERLQRSFMQGTRAAGEPRELDLRVFDSRPSPQFTAESRYEGRRRHPVTTEMNADVYKLHQALDKLGSRQMYYNYDFGDNWEHWMYVKGRAPVGNFYVVEGQGHGVAENIGPGCVRWQKLKAAYKATNPTPEQKKEMHWFEHLASNADPRGLAGDLVNQFDMGGINQRLAAL